MIILTGYIPYERSKEPIKHYLLTAIFDAPMSFSLSIDPLRKFLNQKKIL